MDIVDLKQKLGLRLKELRTAKKLTQENLEKYGFSYRHYSKIERGLVNATIETLAKLAKIFEVSLSDLFSFMETKTKVSGEQEALIIKLNQILKEQDKEKIRKIKIFLDEIL